MIASRFNMLKASSSIRKLGTSSEPLVKTSLYDLHLQIGGKMVPFAGYELPVQYEGLGVLKEHLHCRAAGSASLFDVSHMGQIHWHGKDAVKFIEKMVVGDIASLAPGQSKLSLIMNENGCIVDDTVITNAGNYIHMVVNGACKYKDMDHFKKYMDQFKMDVKMEYQGDRQLVALQGKGAHIVVGRLAPKIDLSKLKFMNGTDGTVAGISGCRVTRCGYTGEDGFEISVAAKDAVKLATALLDQPEVKPSGLGARDSLRLEAGLCLYGNDLDETINPVEAALVWTIGGPATRRRKEQGFLGADKVLEKDGKLKPVSKKRVGFGALKQPARYTNSLKFLDILLTHSLTFRGGTEVFTEDGTKKIGTITSGGFGPTYGKALAMGYVETAFSKDDTKVSVSVRGKVLPAQVTKMPFVVNRE